MRERIWKNAFPQFTALLTALLLAMLAGCGPKVPADHKETGLNLYFDTYIELTTYGVEGAVIQDAFALCARYEALFSRTVEGSDVWRVNHANGRPTQVDQETADLIATALAYGGVSGGVFDITIAPVVELWDFTSGAAVLPDAAMMEERLGLVDYREVRLEGNTVTLPPGAMIDLGAIAKGYITDRLVEFMRERGVVSGMVNAGGNNFVIGTKVDGSNWVTGLQDPFGPRNTIFAAYSASERSIVASGNYERYFELDGVRYHHILDPATGYPVKSGLSSVTIISSKSVDGDALSTTCFILGLEKGLELIESRADTEAVFVTTEGEVHLSSGAAAAFTLA